MIGSGAGFSRGLQPLRVNWYCFQKTSLSTAMSNEAGNAETLNEPLLERSRCTLTGAEGSTRFGPDFTPMDFPVLAFRPAL